MHYVYLLQSEAVKDQRYVGLTSDLRKRLAEHNAGKSRHTSKFVPWKLVTYVAFSDRLQAESIERYIKPVRVTRLPTDDFGRCDSRASLKCL
jgi:putative endonuclease